MKTIPLTKGLVTIVDDDDYERVAEFKWHAAVRRKTVYASRDLWPSRQKVLLHRWLLDAPRDMEVDHRNGNGLDNRRENLRLATRSQNLINCRPNRTNKGSRFRGVIWHKAAAKWAAQISTGRRLENGKREHLHLGLFLDEVEAARAYDRAALQHHGEFAVINFPQKEIP